MGTRKSVKREALSGANEMRATSCADVIGAGDGEIPEEQRQKRVTGESKKVEAKVQVERSPQP